jgi:alpha-dioxygenase
MFDNSLQVFRRVSMAELVGSRTKAGLESIGNEELIVSMGHQACGALMLWNYPQWLRDLVPQDVDGRDRPDKVDLPSLESTVTSSVASSQHAFSVSCCILWVD